jgi:bacterioferritin
MTTSENPITALLNELIGAYWTAYAQHQTHVSMAESWGLQGLADGMRAHVADEPATIRSLVGRLLMLGGQPGFSLGAPRIGKTLGEVLRNDFDAQARVRPLLNEAAERVGAGHDATTRNLLERILDDEERHLDWLRTEVDLYEKLGEPLYVASRLR